MDALREKSESIANLTMATMTQRGLDPAFSEWVLKSESDLILLLGVLDVRRLARIEHYTNPHLLHHLSTVCGGTPLLISNTSGLRFAYVLGYRSIPSSVEFPGFERGVVRLGIGDRGNEVKTTWDKLGHLLVGGQIGMGKSNFLRLITHQAVAEGMTLYLADIDQRTFSMLENHPALGASIASTPDEAHILVAHALAEIDRRNALYGICGGYPESLSEYNSLTRSEKLPRALVILDEYNSTATILGGARGAFCKDVAMLAFRGRKFGVNLVLAAQDFRKETIGDARDQMSAVCFRVRSHALTRLVDCAGAENIPETKPGRAISSRWGVIQTFFIDKSKLISGAPSVLSEQEIAMIDWALAENNSYLPLAEIKERLGLSHGKTRELALDWQRRDWLHKDAGAHNTRYVTPALADLADKLKSQQTPQTRPKTDKRPENRPTNTQQTLSEPTNSPQTRHSNE